MLTGQENSVAQLALSLPANPTTADILRMLVQAEQAGFDRAMALAEAGEVAPILRRQAT